MKSRFLISIATLIVYVESQPILNPKSTLSAGFFPVVRNGAIKLERLNGSYNPGLFESEPKVDNSDIMYFLYSQKNKETPFLITNNEVKQLKNTTFDGKKTNLFIVHGWTNDYASPVNTRIRTATLEKFDYNVFVTDWSVFSKEGYIRARDYASPIGKLLGQFINEIQREYTLNGSSFILVGHSLGANVAGVAGSTLKSKADRVTGLDPAATFYSSKDLAKILDATDGNYVEIIHTSILGFDIPMGHTDYFPNGGRIQPGCGLEIDCSHSRAYEYFAESITRGPVFQSYACASWNAFSNGTCKSTKKSFMGELTTDESASGSFFLTTAANPPYGLDN